MTEAVTEAVTEVVEAAWRYSAELVALSWFTKKVSK